MSNPIDFSAAIEEAIKLGDVEFAENPSARCPCILLLDTSGSMKGEPIALLNKAIHAFRDELVQDTLAAQRVEVAVVTFDTSVNLVQPFVTADKFVPPTLTADGTTAMGTAIDFALNLARDRKREYADNGVQYYRPWVFMITDGEPQGEEPEAFQRAAARLRAEEKAGRLVFFAVGVGKANFVRLTELSQRPPMRAEALKFTEMFVWLSRSMQRVSHSQSGEQVPLPQVGWGSVAV